MTKAVSDSLSIKLPRSSFDLPSLTAPIPREHGDEVISYVAFTLARGGASKDLSRYVVHQLGKCCDPPFTEKEIEAKIRSAREQALRKERNIYAEIRKYVEDASEYFTIKDIYSDLSLFDEKSKATARQAIKKIKDEGIIEQSNRQGCYRKIIGGVEAIDLTLVSTECVEINLPFGLEKYVHINPKDLIVIGGTPNSGKTSMLLDLVTKNMDKWKCHYFSTEMGGSSCRRRIEKHKSLKLTDWRWKFYDTVPNYEHIIKPDALNFIDYVEEFEGESYKIPGILAKIQRRLKSGVAVVALQKKKGASYGVGGEMTKAKPALFLGVEPEPPGNVLRVHKAKDWDGENPNGMYCKFKILGGINLIETRSWDIE